MRIAVLYEQWEGTEEYPGAEADEQAHRKGGKRLKRPKLDRDEIFEALEKLGHEPFYQLLDGTDASLAGLARCKADLFFNLAESFGGDDGKDMNVAAWLDLIGKHYTGSDARGLILAQDKGLAKKIFHFHDLHVPFFAVSWRGRLESAQDIRFPLIVKPAGEDGSIGIDSGSVVNSVKELMERIHYIHEEFDSPALIEEYIDGREIYAGVLGNERPEALPLIELDLSKLPEGAPRIAGYDVKFDRDSDAYKKTKSAPVEDLDDKTRERLEQTALTAFQVLKLRDYARIDMRLTPEGKIYVLEANPNPWLSSSAEFTMAARKSGRTYTQTIGEIVDLASARYEE
ncbi:MAG TPA: D-alanine--D-alanine ligase [Thermoanaerobaculia bacterium]|nr:D-alanine--D-alanine ligase [Thermoanaerobaculia bacterium]